ncbi:MAG: universal stress protein [Chloroflexota bacterium]
MYSRIVIALDGSSRGEAALREGVELAKALHAPVHLLQVADVTWVRFGAPEAAVDYAQLSDELEQEKREASEYLTRHTTRLRGEGLTITSTVGSGFAARGILDATKPGDLLVMSSHGRSGPVRWLLGSVAEEVTRHATVPVLLVRASEE